MNAKHLIFALAMVMPFAACNSTVSSAADPQAADSDPNPDIKVVTLNVFGMT